MHQNLFGHVFLQVHLEQALNFALIGEEWNKNELSYVDAVTLKVRLHSLIIGKYHDIFTYDKYVTTEEYLTNLLISDNKRHQMINIHFDDIDDTMATVITKIFSRIIFEPIFEVKIIIVFLKSTVLPFESVNLPSSKICNIKLNTSG